MAKCFNQAFKDVDIKKLVEQTYQKETKMTREEAVNKCYGIPNMDNCIKTLEALGLIKFDQPVENFTPAYLIGNERVQKLIANGYRIVKLGKWTGVRLDPGNRQIIHTGELIDIQQEHY